MSFIMIPTLMLPTALMASARVSWSNIVAPPTADITTSISYFLRISIITSLSPIEPWSCLHTYISRYINLYSCSFKMENYL